MSLQNTAVSRLRADSPVKQPDAAPALVRVNEQRSLRECVKEAVHTYFHHLDGQDVTEVYDMVLAEIEAPLLEVVMQHVRNNQSRAATLLGLNRGTLRKKLKQYGLL